MTTSPRKFYASEGKVEDLVLSTIVDDGKFSYNTQHGRNSRIYGYGPTS